MKCDFRLFYLYISVTYLPVCVGVGVCWSTRQDSSEQYHIEMKRNNFVSIIFSQLFFLTVQTASPSRPPCAGASCISLCCPSGSAFTLTGQYEGDRCEAEPRVERTCQPYQDLPGWSDDWGQADKFVCPGKSKLVPAEVMYGQQDFRITEDGKLVFDALDPYINVTESVTYETSDFCLVFTDIPDYYDYEEEGSGDAMESKSIRALYSVCYEEEEERGRVFTGIFYPTAIFISDFFIFITLCVYLFVEDLRKKIFGKITIGFLLNVFICYTFLGIQYSLDLFFHNELLDTVFCTALGYIIQHSFIGLFFWMSAMALNVAYTFSNTFNVKRSTNQRKSLLLNICYAQGFALLITGITIGMDFFGPCDYVLPNMGKYSCFLGSEYNPGSSFFTTSEFLYFYLVISITMVCNMICFIITGSSLISHWWQMKDLQSR